MSELLEGNYSFTLDKILGAALRMQTVELPAITLTERIIPMSHSIEYSQPGEKLIFDKLNIQFIVDDRMENYLDVIDWMWKCVDPNTGKLKGEALKSDGVLTIYDKHNIPMKHMRFHSCFPNMLGPLMFNNAGTENRHIIATLTLSYSHWHCEESTVTQSILEKAYGKAT